MPVADTPRSGPLVVAEPSVAAADAAVTEAAEAAEAVEAAEAAVAAEAVEAPRAVLETPSSLAFGQVWTWAGVLACHSVPSGSPG